MKRWVAACSISILPLLTHAQDATMPEVTVTGSGGTLLSPDFESAKAAIQQYPGAVTAVSSAHFNTSRGAYLEDFIPYTPGVIIESGQGSEDTEVSVRGSGVQSDDIAGVEILLDGMAINQGDGEAFLQDLDLHSVKYAEVYKGADALRYGGITLGGAVNLVTKTGEDAPPLEAWGTAGSFGLYEEGVVSGWHDGALDAFLSLSNHSLDGFRDHSQENDQKLFLSLGAQLGPSAENRLYLFMGRVDQNNPSSLTKEEMNANPTQTDPESVAQDWDTTWSYFKLADRFAVKGDDWKFQIGGYYNHRDQLQRQEYDDDEPLGIVRFYSDDFGGDMAFETTAELMGQRNRFVIGVLPTFESEADTSYENLDGNAGSIISADKTFAANVVVYTENQHYFTDSLSLLTGLQYVYAQRAYWDRLALPADGNQTNYEDWQGVNPKIGALYEWAGHDQAYLNVSRSFEPPSFDESLETADDGDQLFNRLNAQKAITLEAGTRGKWGPFSWDVAAYRSWVEDELLDLTDGHGNPLGTVNASRVHHEGFEAGVETELAHGLLAHGAAEDRITLEQTFTISDFHFAHDPVYGDNRIAGTPVDFYKAELRYEHPCGFYCGPNVEWNVVKYPVDEANSLFADPYALLGFRMGYQAPAGWDIYLEAKNLTDQIYAATIEPVGDARIEGSDSFNPGNGRSFYGGISWSW
ncbi:MAG TPA: TonB-dependent receptor [Chthoniobacteraceae bacterium]|nr:TonB-dependent receptor [Chthoniobacteraceae bacterium]